MSFWNKNTQKFIFILLFSFLAGAVGGLFGTGGGIFLVFLFSRVFGEDEGYDRRDIFAMTVLSVMIMSMSSLFSYMKSGAVGFYDIAPSILPAAAGGLLGAFLLDRISMAFLNKLFAVLIVYAGAVLVFR